MSLRDSVTKKAFVDAINDANGTRIGVNQIDFTGVESSANSTRNSKVHAKASAVAGNTVEGQADFNYNRVDLKSLESVLSTTLPARPLVNVSDVLEEINRNCKLNLEVSDIIDSAINLKGEVGESFTLRCSPSSPKYTGTLTFTLVARAAYLVRGKVSVKGATKYRVYGATSSATFPDYLYAYLSIGGIVHPIDKNGYFTTQVETGEWDIYYAAPSLGTVGSSLPFTELHRLVAFNGNKISGSVFMYNNTLREIGDDVFLGNTNPVDANRTFFQCRNLVKVGSGFANHAGGFSSLYQTFSQCSALADFGDTENPQTNHPNKTISGLFNNCNVLKNIPAGLFKGMVNVTDASNAFTMAGNSTPDGCTLGEGMLDDMVSLTTAAYMFDYCQAVKWPARLFKTHPNLSNVFSVLSHTNIDVIEDGFFAGCSGSGITATAAFQKTQPTSIGASLFPQGARVGASSIFSTATIASMSVDVFKGAVLTTLDNAFNGANVTIDFPNILKGQTEVTSLFSMFSNANINLTEENATLFADLVKVTNISQLFYGTKFRSGYCPPGLLDKLVNVTNLVMCFRGASGGTAKLTIPVGIFANQGLATDFSNIFVSTTNIEFLGSVLPKAKSAKSLYDAFGSCGATSFPADLLAYADNVTNGARLFEGCVVSSLPENIFESMVNCTTISSLFIGAKNLTTLPANIFKPFGKVTTAAEMFSNIKQSFEVPEGLFDPLVSVTDIHYLFRYAPKVTIPKGMFAKLPLLSLAYSLFDRAELTGDLTDFFHPELYKNKPNVSGLFYNLTLTNLNVGKTKANIPLTGTVSTMFGNSKNGDVSVDDFLQLFADATENTIPLVDSTTNTTFFLLNALWLVGSRDALVRALWGVTDATTVNKSVVDNALSGTKNLT